MKKTLILLSLFWCIFATGVSAKGKSVSIKEPSQYLIISVPTYDDSAVLAIANRFKPYNGSDKAIGAGIIISYLSQPSEQIQHRLRNFLTMAQQHNLPVVIELEGINYWQAHPELWNWWDPQREGYNPDNRNNVEWSGWTPDSAVKIGWRNWGSQHRVLPMPNLSSPQYVDACHTELRKLVPIIMDWWKALPADKKYLLVAVQIGVECSIGANNWYYPGGNELLDKSEKDDPKYGLDHSELPSRGVSAIGYAAVKTAGIASHGKLTEKQVAQAVNRYVFGLSKLSSKLGVPRDKLFVHAGGWKPGESVYYVALNKYVCPGWSFYGEASHDPRADKTAMDAVSRSNAPYWGAVEWMMFDAKSEADWLKAYRNMFSVPKLKYVQARHWGSICNNPQALNAVQAAVDGQQLKAENQK